MNSARRPGPLLGQEYCTWMRHVESLLQYYKCKYTVIVNVQQWIYPVNIISFPSIYGMSHGKVWDFLNVVQDMTITAFCIEEAWIKSQAWHPWFLFQSSSACPCLLPYPMALLASVWLCCTLDHCLVHFYEHYLSSLILWCVWKASFSVSVSWGSNGWDWGIQSPVHSRMHKSLKGGYSEWVLWVVDIIGSP